MVRDSSGTMHTWIEIMGDQTEDQITIEDDQIITGGEVEDVVSRSIGLLYFGKWKRYFMSEKQLF